MWKLTKTLSVFVFLLLFISCKKTDTSIELSGHFESNGKMYYKGNPLMYTASGKVTDSAIINAHVNRAYASLIVPGFTNPFRWVKEDSFNVTSIDVENNKGNIYFNYYGSMVTSSMSIEGSGADKIISMGPVSNTFYRNSCTIISDEIITPKPIIHSQLEWLPGQFQQSFTYRMPLLARSSNEVELPLLLRWVLSGSYTGGNCFSIVRSHHNIDPHILSRLNVKDTVILQEAYISLIKK
jgi:hypothetical protein